MASILYNAGRKIGLGYVIRALDKIKNPIARINLHFARPRSAPTRFLSIATIFKDEAPNLAEWLEFHRLVGVEHVYLYDNGSTDDSHTVLESYVREGFVSVIPWAFPYFFAGTRAQRLAYAHAILNFGIHWRWMAFIDIDEFLFPVDGNSLPATLADYEGLPAVAAYWTMYGFNGHESRPAGLTIENYTKRAPYGVGAKPKSIVDPSKVIGIESAHMLDFAEGRKIAYDEQKRLARREDEHGPSNILRLNHYFTRSRQEFDTKINTYAEISGLRTNMSRRLSRMLEEGAFHDDTILRFVPEIKRRLQARDHDPQKAAIQCLTGHPEAPPKT